MRTGRVCQRREGKQRNELKQVHENILLSHSAPRQERQARHSKASKLKAKDPLKLSEASNSLRLEDSKGPFSPFNLHRSPLKASKVKIKPPSSTSFACLCRRFSFYFLFLVFVLQKCFRVAFSFCVQTNLAWKDAGFFFVIFL